MQLPNHAMKTISDDGILYFHLIREKERNCISLASIPDGIPRGNWHREKTSILSLIVQWSFWITSHLKQLHIYTFFLNS